MQKTPNVESAFRREIHLDIDAAMVGIHKDRWESAQPDWPYESVIRAMRLGRFDVLPVADEPKIGRYFATRVWGDFDSVPTEPRQIEFNQRIPYDTRIRDVIGALAQGKDFLFLDHNGQIVGLISAVNLNCRVVRVYLYALIHELEVLLTEHLYADANISDERVLGFLATKGDDETKKVVARFREAQEQNFDLRLPEYLYLKHIEWAITEFGRHTELGVGKTRFGRQMFKVACLRNDVAHANNSIIGRNRKVKELDGCLTFIEDMLAQLRLRGQSLS